MKMLDESTDCTDTEPANYQIIDFWTTLTVVPDETDGFLCTSLFVSSTDGKFNLNIYINLMLFIQINDVITSRIKEERLMGVGQVTNLFCYEIRRHKNHAYKQAVAHCILQGVSTHRVETTVVVFFS